MFEDRSDQSVRDKDAFSYLKSVRVIDKFDQDRRKLRTLTLWFYQNEYFSNETIDMSILYMTSEADDPDVVRSSHINWFEGKDLTVKRIKKKQKNKKSGK